MSVGGSVINQTSRKEKGLYDLYRAMALRAAGRDTENLLCCAHAAARLAWLNHHSWRYSLWSDRELEEALTTQGKAVPGGDRGLISGDHAGIIFVASTLYDTGGHSETIRIWSDLLRENHPRQLLVLTAGCGQDHHFPRLQEYLVSRGVRIIKMSPAESASRRVGRLKGILQDARRSVVFLFIHPDDAVAVSACGALRHRVRFVFNNHADIDFWLGAGCFDQYVDFRRIGAEISQRQRKVRRTLVIPLTTDIGPVRASRDDLGIPKKATVSVSLGSLWKTTAERNFCYFQAINRLLSTYPDHYHLFITTPPPRRELQRVLPINPDLRNRFRITGPFADVRPFYSMADFLIETFPLIGGYVRTEAAALGLPMVVFRHPYRPMFSELEVLNDDYPLVARCEDEVVECSSRLIEDRGLRDHCSRLVREGFASRCSPEIVRQALLGLVEEAA